MLLWVVLKMPFTTNEPHCFFALTLWKYIIVCNLPVPNNFLYSWKSTIACFCWIWCEDFFIGLSYNSPAYTDIMKSLFLLFLFFLLAIVWWVDLGSLYRMWNSPDTFLQNCCLARHAPVVPTSVLDFSHALVVLNVLYFNLVSQNIFCL